MINGVRLDDQNNQVNLSEMKNQVRAAEAGRDTALVRNLEGEAGQLAEAENETGIVGGLNTTVRQALNEAGLPVNERNSAIVREMLDNQMSIDRDSLHRIMTQANIYREADISTLLLMNKNNMPVTHFTAAQLQAYINNEQNLTLQIGDAVDSLMEYLAGEPETGSVSANLGVLELLSGNTAPADEAVLQNSAAVQSMAENVAQAENGIVNMLSTGQGPAQAVLAAGAAEAAETVNEAEILNMQQTTSVENVIDELGTDSEGSGANWMNGFGSDSDGTNFDTAMDFSMQSNTAAASEEHSGGTLAGLLNEGELKELNELSVKVFGKEAEITGNSDAKEFLNNLYNSALEMDNEQLQELFKSPIYQKLISKALGSKFTLDPSDIDSSEKLDDFYKETFSTLSKLQELAGKEEAVADKFSKPMDNIKFMDTLNDVFPYIQLPLKLAEGNTKGELYVYKKGRTKTDPNESKSVLLHLDMKKLGPTDIHLELKDAFLKLRFFCDNDASKALLEEHFPELDAALSAKSFTVNSEFSVRTTDTGHLAEILSGEESTPEFKYNFDIRA